MFLFVIYLVFAIAIGYWAKGYNRNGALWGVLAFFISPLIAGIFLLAAGPDEGGARMGEVLKVCPKCFGKNRAHALVCLQCGREFDAGDTGFTPAQ